MLVAEAERETLESGVVAICKRTEAVGFLAVFVWLALPHPITESLLASPNRNVSSLCCVWSVRETFYHVNSAGLQEFWPLDDNVFRPSIAPIPPVPPNRG